MTGEDILNTFKFSCLLVIRFLVYSWFVCISLMKKSEVDNQILRKKKDKNSKKMLTLIKLSMNLWMKCGTKIDNSLMFN